MSKQTSMFAVAEPEPVPELPVPPLRTDALLVQCDWLMSHGVEMTVLCSPFRACELAARMNAPSELVAQAREAAETLARAYIDPVSLVATLRRKHPKCRTGLLSIEQVRIGLDRHIEGMWCAVGIGLEIDCCKTRLLSPDGGSASDEALFDGLTCSVGRSFKSTCRTEIWLPKGWRAVARKRNTEPMWVRDALPEGWAMSGHGWWIARDIDLKTKEEHELR